MAYLAMEDALCSLLPTHKGILPSPLVQLSASLVAQSRTKASNLRVEEEIARTYLCAHIACERPVALSSDMDTL
jgi:origin recognition complex subunit 6